MTKRKASRSAKLRSEISRLLKEYPTAQVQAEVNYQIAAGPIEPPKPADPLVIASEVFVEVEIERHARRKGAKLVPRGRVLSVRHACEEIAKRGRLILASGNEPIVKAETLRAHYNEAAVHRDWPMMVDLQRRVNEALGRPSKPFGQIWGRPPRK